MKADRSKWVQKIHAHAMARYEKGWDFIVECYGDDVLELIDDEVTTYRQAIKELTGLVKLHQEQESNCSWGGEW